MKNRMRKCIEKYGKSFKWTPKDFYWKHALLVRKYALFIQKHVGGDRDTVEIAALLHDIGKTKLLAPGHEKISAQLVNVFLEEIGFNKHRIKKILVCIRYGDFRSIEMKTLRSADSMSLIMDKSGGKEWFFENVLKGDRKLINREIRKSYSQIKFDFAQKVVEGIYKELLRKYRSS